MKNKKKNKPEDKTEDKPEDKPEDKTEDNIKNENSIENDIIEKNNIISKNNDILLVYSSFIFTTNIITAFYMNYYLYAILFSILTITSVIHHSKFFYKNYYIYSKILDRFAVFCVIIYGGIILYNKIIIKGYSHIILNLSIVICFLLVGYLYTYGYYVNEYCFDKDYCIQNNYHALLHIISSIGHHLIIFYEFIN